MAAISQTGASGMIVQQAVLTTKANNIANSRTTAFDPMNVVVSDNSYINIRTPGSVTASTGTNLPTGLQIGTGAKLTGTYRTLGQGSFQETGNAYDMLIDGDGYFQVLMPDGTTAYTRDGHFTVDKDRNIVDHEGRILQPGLTMPTNAVDVNISLDGIISTTVAGQTTPTQVGQIRLATFNNAAGLKAIGGNLYTETISSGTPIDGNPADPGFGQIYQNGVETSKVEMILEMTDMLAAQKTYEACANVVKMGHETDRIDASLAQG